MPTFFFLPHIFFSPDLLPDIFDKPQYLKL